MYSGTLYIVQLLLQHLHIITIPVTGFHFISAPNTVQTFLLPGSILAWRHFTPGGGGGHFRIEGDGDVPLDRV